VMEALLFLAEIYMEDIEIKIEAHSFGLEK
jgi:hypothetical protein